MSAKIGFTRKSGCSPSRRFPAARTRTKKKTYGYIERDQLKRQTFKDELLKWSSSQIVYVDESGMDNREDYDYGWNECGQRFYALKSGKRQGRINMIAALCNKELFAPFTVEGPWNRVVFETWLSECLIPVLQPGQLIIQR